MTGFDLLKLKIATIMKESILVIFYESQPTTCTT